MRRVYRGNSIGAEGARALADALTRNTALTTLDLRFVFSAHLCVPVVIVGRKKEMWEGGLVLACEGSGKAAGGVFVCAGTTCLRFIFLSLHEWFWGGAINTCLWGQQMCAL